MSFTKESSCLGSALQSRTAWHCHKRGFQSKSGREEAEAELQEQEGPWLLLPPGQHRSPPGGDAGQGVASLHLPLLLPEAQSELSLVKWGAETAVVEMLLLSGKLPFHWCLPSLS